MCSAGPLAHFRIGTKSGPPGEATMSEPSYYVHIGMHKSASTYIQSNIFDGLAKAKRILYADPYMLLGVREINDEPIISRINKVRVSPYYSLRGQFKADVHKGILEIIEKNAITSGKVVISNEYFVGAQEHNFFLDVNAVLAIKEVFETPKILLVIRRQDEFLESWYANSIRGGRWEPVHQALNYYDNKFGDWKSSYRLNIDVKDIDYYQYVRHLEELFGADNVTVLPFELLKDDPPMFNNALLVYLGEEGAACGTKHVNVKFPYVTLALTRYINRFINNGMNPLPILPQRPLNIFLRRYAMREYHERPAWIRRLMWLNNNVSYVNALYPVGKLIPLKRTFLNDRMRSKIMEIHDESNRKLDEHRNLGLRRYGYYR